MTGTSNNFSMSRISWGASADDEDRMKRRVWFFTRSVFRAACSSIARCIVGTAVYQVGENSLSQLKNLETSKPGVHTMLAPAEIEDNVAPIRPWMWKRGMIFKQRSFCDILSTLRMFSAELHIFLLVNGTILGREVVPEVCRTNATSLVLAHPLVF